jgi:hypothetical protein
MCRIASGDDGRSIGAILSVAMQILDEAQRHLQEQKIVGESMTGQTKTP